jgi:hypothetical protein
MNILLVIGLALAVCGLAVSVFAKQIGDANENLATVLPPPFRVIGRAAGAGQPLNGPLGIAYNRIGGALVALFGMLLAGFALVAR